MRLLITVLCLILQDAGHYVCEVDVGLGGQAKEVRHQLQILGELSAKSYTFFWFGNIYKENNTMTVISFF